MLRVELEKLIEDKVVKGEMPCGLYNTGLLFVEVKLTGDELDSVSFFWHEQALDIGDYIDE